MIPILTEIDLSKTTKKGGPGFETGLTYLVMHNGNFYVGRFEEQQYGLIFCGFHNVGAQYYPPGENYSSWQRIWRFENAKEIAAKDESAYAEIRRRYAINFHMTSNSQTITEEAPLEAFFYDPDVPAMLPQDDKIEYFDWNEMKI